ncbi:hypothetical protein RRG08_010627 [Elysia crispata]|uniref:Uncharacterized protein n=1 Tax=Elysia crispata TaxID=231223 RepID=A0AAE0Y945_9GAST|nr:hypothetical protein RRG08_010627 [Elysia crispata]
MRGWGRNGGENTSSLNSATVIAGEKRSWGEGLGSKHFSVKLTQQINNCPATVTTGQAWSSMGPWPSLDQLVLRAQSATMEYDSKNRPDKKGSHLNSLWPYWNRAKNTHYVRATVYRLSFSASPDSSDERVWADSHLVAGFSSRLTAQNVGSTVLTFDLPAKLASVIQSRLLHGSARLQLTPSSWAVKGLEAQHTETSLSV